MIKGIPLFLAAPLTAWAAPVTLQNDGFYHLYQGKSHISHQWRGSIPLEYDQKTVLDRTKKESCSGGDCKAFELLTEITAHDLGNGAVRLDVDFTNTSGSDVTRLSGNIITRLNESAKIDLKSEGDGGDHFGMHILPRVKPGEK